MYYIKNNLWKPVSSYFQKKNNIWEEISIGDFENLISNNITMFGGESNISFYIGGPSTLSGTQCNYLAILNNTTDITTSATWSIISGMEYATINQSNGTLTILDNANNSNVIITAKYLGITVEKSIYISYIEGSSTQTNVETLIDESGNTVTKTETITTNTDGSSESTSTTVMTDQSGNTISTVESNTLAKEDGSYNSSSIVYDGLGNPTNGTNISGDTIGNIDTQEIEYDESGNTIVVSYTIDTTATSGVGKDITGDGVNTEFIPFDGSRKGFEFHIRFRSVPSEQPNPPLVTDTEDSGSNYLFNIFSAQDPYRPWSGFMLRWALNKNNYTSSSGAFIFQYIASDGKSNNINITKPNSSIATTGLFDLTVTYDPDLVKYNKKFIVTNNLTSTILKSVDIEFGANDLDFTVGYAINQQGEPYRYSCVQIYDFTITKIE